MGQEFTKEGANRVLAFNINKHCRFGRLQGEMGGGARGKKLSTPFLAYNPHRRPIYTLQNSEGRKTHPSMNR